MEPSQIKTDGTHVGRAPLQYSLRTMFLVMTLLALGVSLLFAASPIVRLVAAGFFLLLLPAVVTVVLIYGQGYARTFCVGAIFPAGVSVWPFQSGMPLIVYGFGRGAWTMSATSPESGSGSPSR